MEFEFSPKTERLRAQVQSFMQREVYPAEKVFERELNEAPSRWQIPPVMEELKRKAKAVVPAVDAETRKPNKSAVALVVAGVVGVATFLRSRSSGGDADL